MQGLDTNILLRIILNDIREHTESVEALLDNSSQRYVVEDLVFAEIVWILQGARYEFSRDQIYAKMMTIINLHQIICSEEKIKKALQYYIKYHTISYADAYLVACAELNDTKPLLTFDRELKTAAPEYVSLLP